MSQQKQNNRIYWIDWVRVVATVLTSLYHGNRFFDNLITDLNLGDSLAADYFSRFMSQWLMPLFFFLSGYSLFLVVQGFHKKNQMHPSSMLQIIFKDRFNKLIIPGIFGIVVLAFLERYISKVYHMYDGSLLDYAKLFWSREFSLSHLWFAFALFGFSVANAPFFLWIYELNYGAHLNAIDIIERQKLVFTTLQSWRSWYVFIVLTLVIGIGVVQVIGSPAHYYFVIMGLYFVIVALSMIFATLKIRRRGTESTSNAATAAIGLSAPTTSVSTSVAIPTIAGNPILPGDLRDIGIVDVHEAQNWVHGAVLVTICIVSNVILFAITDPLPSIKARGTSLDQIAFAMMAFNTFFVAGFLAAVHQVVPLNSAATHSSSFISWLRFLSTPLIILLVPFGEGYAHLDRAYGPYPQRYFFEVGAWYWVLVIHSQASLSCNTQVFNRAKIYEFIRDFAFSLYLFHNVWLYFIAKLVAGTSLSFGSRYIIVQLGAILGSLVCHVLFSLTRVTRWLTGQKTDSAPARTADSTATATQ